MVRKRIKEAAGAIKSFLASRDISVDKVVVFGSYAKNNYTRDSDLDIAIVSGDFDGKDIFQKAKMLKGLKWFLAERFTFPFDIVPMSLKDWQKSSLLSVEFIKEGKVIS